jgi:anti-sigma B factor antagonist
MAGDGEPSPGDVLHIEARYDDTEAAIILDGEFDAAGLARFWGYLSAVLAPPHPLSVAVDAWGLGFIDSSGLMALLRARDAAAEAGVAFRVIKPSPPVRRLVELAGVEELLTDE